jgi:trehalose-6-phosphate synthase
MDVISYRGPGVAGGVSSGLANAWRSQKVTDTSWWFLSNDSLSSLTPESTNPKFFTMLSESTVKGHYQFCNNFLWPIMHDLPVHSSFSEEEFQHYKLFNQIFGQFIAYEERKSKRYFVNDYQLAFLPGYLSMEGGRVSVFWHIPWPKNIAAEHADTMREIVRGMLNSRTIGFHTQEYADNFMATVRELLPQVRMDKGSMRVDCSQQNSQQNIEQTFGLSSFIARPLKFASGQPAMTGTQIVVAPLGIDQEQWATMASAEADERVSALLSSIQGQQLILSVDRADYTKAVLDRMKIVDRFLSEHPSWMQRIAFVQICGRSRSGLHAFDKYWDQCHQLATAVNEKWRTADWQPINWIEDPLPAKSLSVLYKEANTMLVNPVRDGLNLTAKEFIACQQDNPGVLCLSPGAGAWHELGDHALPADPLAQHATVDSIARSLAMPPVEKRWRNQQLKRSLHNNPLQNWWRTLHASTSNAPAPNSAIAATPGDKVLSA